MTLRFKKLSFLNDDEIEYLYYLRDKLVNGLKWKAKIAKSVNYINLEQLWIKGVLFVFPSGEMIWEDDTFEDELKDIRQRLNDDEISAAEEGFWLGYLDES